MKRTVELARRDRNIRINRVNRVIKVVRKPKTIQLNAGGKRGLKGDTGDPATNLVTSVNGEQGVVVLNQDDVLDGIINKQYSATEKTKLAGIATGANVGVVPNVAITGATKTKVTYDAKGLVTGGTDATTADIADSTNKRYVTDANATVIGNTSGTNSGDNATNTQYSGLAASKQDIITGLTASGAELNILDGAILSTTELNYVDGVTSSLQTQLNAKQVNMGADDNYVTDAQLVVIGNTSGSNSGDSAANSTSNTYADGKVSDTVYGAGWDTDTTHAPSKNAVYDKIEAIVLADGDVNGPASSTDNAIARYDGTTGKLLQDSSVTILDTGAVGIGTTNPAQLLHVNSASTTDRVARFSSGSIWGTKLEFYSSGTGGRNYEFGSSADSADEGGGKFYITDATAGAARFIINSTGNVGIGTTAPDKALEINSATGVNLRLTYNDSDGSAANYADFSTSSSGDLTIAPSGGDTLVTGRLASTATAVTIAAAATTFAVASNVVTVTGDALANVVATITGGVSGQMLTLLFVDALVTITDTAAATADTVNLVGAFVGAANTTLTLVYNGTKWYEVCRSVN